MKRSKEWKTVRIKEREKERKKNVRITENKRRLRNSV